VNFIDLASGKHIVASRAHALGACASGVTGVALASLGHVRVPARVGAVMLEKRNALSISVAVLGACGSLASVTGVSFFALALAILCVARTAGRARYIGVLGGPSVPAAAAWAYTLFAVLATTVGREALAAVVSTAGSFLVAVTSASSVRSNEAGSNSRHAKKAFEHFDCN